MIKSSPSSDLINNKLCVCKNKLNKKINFGNLPIVNNYTSKINLKKYPVIISQCEKCQLIHLKYTLPDKLLFPSNYSYLSGHSKEKINTFVAIFPTSKPKYVLIVLLDEPKPNKEYVYYYRDGRPPYKGNWRNTAGWTSVEVAGKIIEKIGPILATKYVELD